MAATSRGGNELAQLAPEIAGQLGAQRRQCVERVVGQRRAAPLPQHGAQLVFGREANAVVDPVDVATDGWQQMAALAVGVVHHRVEYGEPAQPGVVAVQQRQQIGVLVDVDPDLTGAGPERTVAHDGERHDVPAGGFGDEVGADLAAGERAIGKVPERPFAGDRLVHAGQRDRRRG